MSDLARSAIEMMVETNGPHQFEREVTERLRQVEDSLKQIRAAMDMGQI